VLELAFATKELRSACEDAACAEASYGPVVAAALVGRLADLRAAEHPLELPFADARPAAGTDPDRVVVTLAAGRALVIACNHAKPPRGADGAVAWEHVNRIIVLRLE
jgi:hypothetical protein